MAFNVTHKGFIMDDYSQFEEQIGYHKGSLACLAKEKKELEKRLGTIKQLIQMHINSLDDLGINIDKPDRSKLENS